MLGRGGGNDLSSTSIYPFFHVGQMSQLYIQNINCEPHWRASGILFILLLIKIICNWQQPNLGFIKYDVHATCLVYYLFFLDRQFRGDVAILVFLKTMTSYNPTSLTPSHFTEVPVLSQESEQSCICVLGISVRKVSGSCICVLGISVRKVSGHVYVC